MPFISSRAEENALAHFVTRIFCDDSECVFKYRTDIFVTTHIYVVGVEVQMFMEPHNGGLISPDRMSDPLIARRKPLPHITSW